MAKKLAMQDIILTLQQFWAKQGCMLMQAYDNEKGAGTMSPYTFLRAIGPEPWNVATLNRHVGRLTDVMEKIPIVCSSTTSFR